MSEHITLKEFRAWLDGLLAGRDMEREALPTRDQWKLILAKIDALVDGRNFSPYYVWTSDKGITVSDATATCDAIAADCK